MDDNFMNLIDESLSDFFQVYDFNLEEYLAIDGGNKTTAIYFSPLCKLLIYRSTRDGEVNCLIGREVADSHNLNDGNWFYLNSILSDQAEKTIEQLLANVPDEPQSDKTQISTIASKLENNFEMIIENISTTV